MNTFTNVTNIQVRAHKAMKDYKIIPLATLVQSLQLAYVAACKALGLANKLKDKKHRSHSMSMLNKIRHELKKFDSRGLNIFESVSYRGILINKF